MIPLFIAKLVAKPFIGGALSFVKSNWKLVLVGVLALVFLSTVARLNHAKADLVKVRADLKETRKLLTDPRTGQSWQTLADIRASGLSSCTAAQRAQEASLTALRAEGDRLTAAASKAQAEARKARSERDRSATALQNYKAVGATQCERNADGIRRAREGVR
jgi:hypothetical protein